MFKYRLHRSVSVFQIAGSEWKAMPMNRRANRKFGILPICTEYVAGMGSQLWIPNSWVGFLYNFHRNADLRLEILYPTDLD